MSATIAPTRSILTVTQPMSLDSDPFKSGVVLRLNVPIEDLRGYGEAVVDRLRTALAQGVPFIKDRKRTRCYEVRVERERFYIYVLRGASKVLLIAHWEEAQA
jgi:hypothetical protein